MSIISHTASCANIAIDVQLPNPLLAGALGEAWIERYLRKKLEDTTRDLQSRLSMKVVSTHCGRYPVVVRSGTLGHRQCNG